MRFIAMAIAIAALSACGGGGSSGSGSGAVVVGASPGSSPVATPTSTSTASAAPSGPLNASEASRLLTQATFGPTDASIADAQAKGASGWIDAQLATPRTGSSHLAYFDTRAAEKDAGGTTFYESWWRDAMTAPDQLRQRTAFALSQIFVISFQDPNTVYRGAASYYDMLENDAFGNFRKLLEDVTMHPTIARYLTYAGNEKDNDVTGSHPDENYAREVMQLMTIGLHELNNDGTLKRDGAGAAIATYDADDIKGLARVFTGIGYWATTPNATTFKGSKAPIDTYVTPMIFYPQYHSTLEKKFLNVTIPASASPDTAGDIKIALDALFNHPNVGPFIATRLIQQLVTSNPSPAYVGRVATVFNNNGANVRGDIGAVVKAVLMDPEARDTSVVSSLSFGKLREPVIRLANWGRAFGATSKSGHWLLGSTTASIALSQTALTSPSVFNFWRPGYTPPAVTEAGSRGLTAPEFQVVDEVTTATWVNLAAEIVSFGIGGTSKDMTSDLSAEIALANDPAALVAKINMLLFYGQMSDSMKGKLTTAINRVPYPGASEAAARLSRAQAAVFLSLISPEYLIQR